MSKDNAKEFISEEFIKLIIDEKADRWPSLEVLLGCMCGGNLIGSNVPMAALEEKLEDMVKRGILGYYGEKGPKRQYYLRGDYVEADRPRIEIP